MSGDVFAISRIIFSALLAAGGISAIWLGYRLFVQGAGLQKGVDKIDFKADWGKISFAGMSVGGLLMLTSGGWGGLAYLSVPKLEQGLDVLRITDTFKHLQGPGQANANVWPSLPPAGTPVLASDKSPVGTISSVVFSKGNRPLGYVVDGLNNNDGELIFSPKVAKFANGSVLLDMTKEQVDSYWTFLPIEPAKKGRK